MLAGANNVSVRAEERPRARGSVKIVERFLATPGNAIVLRCMFHVPHPTWEGGWWCQAINFVPHRTQNRNMNMMNYRQPTASSCAFHVRAVKMPTRSSDDLLFLPALSSLLERAREFLSPVSYFCTAKPNRTVTTDRLLPVLLGSPPGGPAPKNGGSPPKLHALHTWHINFHLKPCPGQPVRCGYMRFNVPLRAPNLTPSHSLQRQCSRS